jgi:hypothetical protein
VVRVRAEAEPNSADRANSDGKLKKQKEITMKRAILSIFVFAGILAAQPFGPGGPGGGGTPPEGAREPGSRVAALAEVFDMDSADLAEKIQALREQQKSQREASKADFEQIRTWRQELKAAVEADDATQNTAAIGALVLKIEAKQAEMRARREQDREAIKNTVKSWGPGAEAGLARLEEAAALMPAMMQARMLGIGDGGRGDARGRSRHGGGPGPSAKRFRSR